MELTDLLKTIVAPNGSELYNVARVFVLRGDPLERDRGGDKLATVGADTTQFFSHNGDGVRGGACIAAINLDVNVAQVDCGDVQTRIASDPPPDNTTENVPTLFHPLREHALTPMQSSGAAREFDLRWLPI